MDIRQKVIEQSVKIVPHQIAASGKYIIQEIDGGVTGGMDIPAFGAEQLELAKTDFDGCVATISKHLKKAIETDIQSEIEKDNAENAIFNPVISLTDTGITYSFKTVG